jgi:decaprenylphospho-beta-D-erythro-pentofuranosid-2-ulose 2-reductase
MLIGSTSDIGLSLVEALPFADNPKITLVGRSVPKEKQPLQTKCSVEFYRLNLEITDELMQFDSDLHKLDDIDLAIIAGGYLPAENSELNLGLVHKSITINGIGITSVLSSLTKRMLLQPSGMILYISSVATERPRYRNFSYGASKMSADFFIRGLSTKYKDSSVKFLIVRPGYVYTKMTIGLKPAPFAVHKSDVVTDVLRALQRDKKIIYVPRLLKLVFFFVKILPISIFRLIEKKF